MKNTFKIILAAAFMTSVFLYPALSMAQISPTPFAPKSAYQTPPVYGNPEKNPAKPYTLLEPLPCLGSKSNDAGCSTGGGMRTTINFQDYVQYIINLAIALTAFAAVFMIVWGCLQYMSSDAWNSKNEGLKRVKQALLGLLLVLCSYLLLKTIDPRLVEIPTTLVAPLNIDYTKSNFISTWQSEMNKISAEYQKQSDAAIAAYYAAKGEVEGAREQLTLDADELAFCTFDETADCSSLQQKYDIDLNKLNVAEAKAVLTNYEKNSSGYSNLNFSGGEVKTDGTGVLINTYENSDLATIKKLQDAENKNYEAAISGIKEHGENPDVIQKIGYEHDITNYGFAISKDMASDNPDKYSTRVSDIKNIITGLNTIISNSTDPSIKSNATLLKNAADESIKKLENNYVPKYTPPAFVH